MVTTYGCWVSPLTRFVGLRRVQRSVISNYRRVWANAKPLLIFQGDFAYLGGQVMDESKEDKSHYLRYQTPLPPSSGLVELLHSTWTVRVVKCAVELGVIDALDAGPAQSDVVADRLGLDRRGTAYLLDSLTAAGLLSRAELNGRVRSIRPVYELSEMARVYLTSASPLFMGLYLEQHHHLDKMWQRLGDSLKSGKPVMQVEKKEDAEAIFPRLAEAIIPWNFSIASDLVKSLQKSQKGSSDFVGPHRRILDVGAGSAVWSIPFAQADAAVTVWAQDLTGVLDVARKMAQKCHCSEQMRYLPGDWRDVLPDLADREGFYDIAILGHILHAEGLVSSRDLLRKIAALTRSGGLLIIGEFMPNNERTAPQFAVDFALNMYLATSQGCVFSFAEISQLCIEAGFSRVFRHNAIDALPYDSPVVIAVRDD